MAHISGTERSQVLLLPERIEDYVGAKRWNWSELNARVNAMAFALTNECGVGKGHRILVQSSNCNHMFESMLACFRIGAVWVPANVRGTPQDLDWLADSSGAIGMICQADFPQHAATCAQLNTSTLPSYIQQPGPAGASYSSAPTRLIELVFELPAGISLDTALAREIAARGLAG